MAVPGPLAWRYQDRPDRPSATTCHIRSTEWHFRVPRRCWDRTIGGVERIIHLSTLVDVAHHGATIDEMTHIRYLSQRYCSST